MEYMEAKRSYTDAKAKQRALHKRVQTLQQKNQPMHDFKKHLETRLKRLNEQRDGKKEGAKKRFRSMKTKWDENEKLVTLTPVKNLDFSIQLVSLHRKRAPRRFRTVSQTLRRKKKIAQRRFKTSNGLFKTCRLIWQYPYKSKICQRLTRRWYVSLLLQNASFLTLGQHRLNQSHNATRDRQFDLKDQQRQLVEDESRANAEVAEGERTYAMSSN
jgi:hypothetical protein